MIPSHGSARSAVLSLGILLGAAPAHAGAALVVHKPIPGTVLPYYAYLPIYYAPGSPALPTYLPPTIGVHPAMPRCYASGYICPLTAPLGVSSPCTCPGPNGSTVPGSVSYP